MNIYLDWKSDLVLQANGDFLLVNGVQETQQRIIRRLLTNPGSYIWHPDYGAGLGQYIGRLLTPAEFDSIKGTITSQIFNEASVAKNPPPKITLTQSADLNILFCTIKYCDAVSQQPFVLSFQVSH